MFAPSAMPTSKAKASPIDEFGVPTIVLVAKLRVAKWLTSAVGAAEPVAPSARTRPMTLYAAPF
jgi:hypothetical protein